MGVVGLPSRVTGLAAISIREEITFMPGCQASSNSSQYDLEVGVFWRLIFMMTVLESAIRYHFCSQDLMPTHTAWRGKLLRCFRTFNGAAAARHRTIR